MVLVKGMGPELGVKVTLIPGAIAEAFRDACAATACCPQETLTDADTWLPGATVALCGLTDTENGGMVGC